MTSFFRCFDCGGRTGPLIQGSCRFCEPELHARHQAQLDAVGNAMDRFKAETGKDALAHWYEFEAWASKA